MRVFYKDIYKHKYRLVFSNIRHKTMNNYDSTADSNQLAKIRKIINIIKFYKHNELEIIFTNYLRFFTIPYKDEIYFVIPSDCPIRKFRWAVGKYNSTIHNNEINTNKIKPQENETISKNYLFQNNKEDKNNLTNYKRVRPKYPSLATSASINCEKPLIEIPVYGNGIKSPNNKIPTHFTEGDIKPSKKTTKITLRKRNQSVIQQLKELYKNRCQICNIQLEIGDDKFYSEVHHIQPLGSHNGPDITKNMLVVCPNHHIMFDKGAITIDLNENRVYHVNKNHELNGKSINIQHKIDSHHLKYYNLNIYIDNITNQQTEPVVDYEDTVVFSDGEQLTEVTLENYYNRFLMNNMQRMLLYKKTGEQFHFNDFYYQVTEIRKASE